MTDLYIYYRVPAGQAAALAPKVRVMQDALGGGQLKRRPGDRDGLQTWMEVYASVTDDFPARLEQAVREAGLQQHIDGLRHTEVFTDLS